MKTQERYRVIRNFLIMGVFLFLSFTINAANAPITSVGQVCNATPGQLITVPITVTGFNTIGSFYLNLEYDYTKLQIQAGSWSKNPSLTGLYNINDTNRGNGIHRLILSWTGGENAITLPDGSSILDVVFKYISGPASLTWYISGSYCQYTDPSAIKLDDAPKSSFYINGSVSASCSTIPTITTNGPTSLCEGASVELTASAGSAYKWSPGGATTQKITVSTSGSYTVEVTDATGAKATSEATVVTVTPSLPVSVSIQASANPVCAGTLVTYTPTPVNGGVPIYRWYVNNEYFANTPTLSFLPENGDEVYLEMTSSLACPSSNPAISNKINMTVNPELPVSVSIAASQNLVCFNTRVEYTATPVNGGENPTYQWKVNGIDGGSNSDKYAYYPANGDVITCVLSSNASCKSGSPATSEAIKMEVGSVVLPSVSLKADPVGAVCEGTPVTFTAIPEGGGDSPKYFWYKNDVMLSEESAGYSYVPVNGDKIQVGMLSNSACADKTMMHYSDPITVTVNPKLPVSVSVSASSTEVCEGTPVTFTANPVNEGTAPKYQWLVNGAEKGTNEVALTYTPENGDVVSCVLTSNLTCTSENPAESKPVTMIVNPILEAAVSIAAVPSEAVIAGTSVTFTATPVNGGPSPAYQWKVNGEDKGVINPEFSFVPNNGDLVSCVMTSNATGCISGSPANSNEIIVPVISTGTTVLTYRFANPRIHKISGIDHFEFDVQLKADVSGSNFLKGNVNLIFNNSTLSPIAADWIATPVSGSVTDLAVSGSNVNIQLDVPNSLSISTTYQTLVTISGKITNGSGEAGIDFNEGNMNGKQFSKLVVSPGLELYQSPNAYDEPDFINTWVGRVYAMKYGWTQMNGLNWSTPVNTSIWEGFAGVYDLHATNIRIHKAGNLTIGSDGRLTVSGNTDIIPENGLVIESDINGTGSLITGTSSGTASVQRYMTTDAWHIVASPVSGQSISNFLGSNANVATDDDNFRGMMDYNPILNDWNNYFTNSTAGDLETGIGFSIRTNANSSVTFTGTLQSGNQSATGLTPALWNCVGNPYTSAIGINKGSSSTANFLTDNAANLDPNFGAIYVWDNPDANNGVWGVYKVISNAVTDAAFDVQQGQAFMVRMNSSATSVSFNPEMQIHNPGLDIKSSKGIWSSIKLQASVNSVKSSTTIAFNSAMTKGLDPTYDAGLLRGNSDLVLYSKLVEDNGIPFAIQALPDNDFGAMIISLGVESKVGGEIVFSTESLDLPANCQVIFEDQQSHTFTDLSIDDYTTTIESNASGSDRFRIHVSFLTTKLDQGALVDHLSAYAVRNIEIRIKGNVSNQAVATLYDVQGRVVLIKTLEEGSLNVVRTPNIKSAIYLLSVRDGEKVQRFKIPVNQ
jgi:hypothetical protein